MKMLFGGLFALMLAVVVGCGGSNGGSGGSTSTNDGLANNTYIAETGFPPQTKNIGPLTSVTLRQDNSITIVAGASGGTFPQPEFVVDGRLDNGGVFTGRIVVQGSLITQTKASYQLEGGVLTLYLSDIGLTPGWIFLRTTVSTS